MEMNSEPRKRRLKRKGRKTRDFKLILPKIELPSREEHEETRSMNVVSTGRMKRKLSFHSTLSSGSSQKGDQESASIFSGKSTPRQIRVNPTKPKSGKRKKYSSLDEIPELSENVSELMEHTRAASYRLMIISFQLTRMILSLIFGKIHDAVSFLLHWLFTIIFQILKHVVLVLILLFLFLQNLCPKKKRKNPFSNKTKLDILKKLDKIWENKKMTIVLDLDHTLVKTSRVKMKVTTPKKKNKKQNDSLIEYNKVKLNPIDGPDISIHSYSRPYLNEFLDEIGEIFDVVVYTAAERVYADQIIDSFDFWKIIKRRFYRQSCEFSDGKMKKHLSIIMGEKLKNVIMLENLPGIVQETDNVILVKKWLGTDPEDNELLKLAKFFKEHKENVKYAQDYIEIWKQLGEDKEKKDSMIDTMAS